MSRAASAASPLVSVLMPTLDGQRYIASALRSLQEQDHADLEIIVIDDASSDATVEIVSTLAEADPRIVLLQAHNRSIAASRNDGLARARGAYVTFLDHDDLCPAGKIARQVAHLTREPHVAAVFGQTMTFTSTETIAAKVEPDRALALTMSLSAALFRRSAFDRVGLLDPSYKLADDFDLILRMIEAGLEIAVEDAVATLHRRHATQASADLDATRREIILALAHSVRRRRATGNLRELRHPLVAAMRP